jgi:hypothetical protein
MHRLTHAAQKRKHLAHCSGGRALAPLGSLSDTLPVDALTAGQLLVPAPCLLCLAGTQQACLDLDIFLSLHVLCGHARQAKGLHLLCREFLEIVGGGGGVRPAQLTVREIVVLADGAGVAGDGTAEVVGGVATKWPDSASCNSRTTVGLVRLDAVGLGLSHDNALTGCVCINNIRVTHVFKTQSSHYAHQLTAANRSHHLLHCTDLSKRADK